MRPCVRQAPRGTESDRGMHKEVSLVYFSTFEPIELRLTPDSIMQRAGVPMLYYSASNPRLPCLYICPVANVLGRAPLIPCFIGGNCYPTVPHRFKDDRRLGDASADTQRDRGNGSTAAGSTRPGGSPRIACQEGVPESLTHFACVCPKFREARTSAHNQV